MSAPSSSATGSSPADTATYPYGLLHSDLTLLGDSWMTNQRLRLVRDWPRLQIVPARFSIIGSLVMMGILASFFYAWWWAWWNWGPGELGAFGWLVATAATLLGVFGPPIASYQRIRYLNSISPLVEYDAKTGSISILAGEEAFEREQVVCLLIVTAGGGEDLHTEFHLIADEAGHRQRHLLMTDYGSTPGVFRKAALRFATEARVPLVRAWPAKPSAATSPMQTEILVDAR